MKTRRFELHTDRDQLGKKLCYHHETKKKNHDSAEETEEEENDQVCCQFISKKDLRKPKTSLPLANWQQPIRY